MSVEIEMQLQTAEDCSKCAQRQQERSGRQWSCATSVGRSVPPTRLIAVVSVVKIYRVSDILRLRGYGFQLPTHSTVLHRNSFVTRSLFLCVWFLMCVCLIIFNKRSFKCWDFKQFTVDSIWQWVSYSSSANADSLKAIADDASGVPSTKCT